MTKVVAIHQPNFFPWLGYFDKIIRSDQFIFLDHVQFPKTGGVWSNRVKMLLYGEAKWVTAPIMRNFHGVRAIYDMEFQPGNPWREKMLINIETNYSKMPYFKEMIDFFGPLIMNKEDNLSRYNINAILFISQRLGVSSEKFNWSSKLPFQGQSNEMLATLTKSIGGDTYMCGGGADGYQDDALFAQRGVQLRYQSFQHPAYPQRGQAGFIAGLSVIDAAMNLGWEGVKELLSKDAQCKV